MDTTSDCTQPTRLASIMDDYKAYMSSVNNGELFNMTIVYDIMKYECNRLLTFNFAHDSQWKVEFISPEELANAGFFYCLSGDRVQCPFCTGIVSNWERGMSYHSIQSICMSFDNFINCLIFCPSGDRPLAEHARHFPRCPFIMEEDVGNVAIGEDPIRGPKRRIGHDVCGTYAPTLMLLELQNEHNSSLALPSNEGILHRGPVSSNYNSIDARKRSFLHEGWDTSAPVSTDRLAEAGFYSIGKCDAVRF